MVALCMAATAQAQTSVDGLAFSIVTDLDYAAPRPYGYLQPAARVGSYGALLEWQIGVAEFDLRGLAAGDATLSFHYATGARNDPAGSADRAPRGEITVNAYSGDNVAAVSDYGAPSLGTLGSFDLATRTVGDVFTFDVTSLLSGAVARGDHALGIRLIPQYTRQVADFTFTTYDSFVLGVVSAVPEPARGTLLLAGLGVTGWLAGRRRGAAPIA